MNRSQLFTAAHAAARTMMVALPYNQRFALALKQAYLAAKQAAAPQLVKYVLRDAEYFGGNHSQPLTYAEICALASSEYCLSLEGGYGAGFVYDFDTPIAKAA